MFKKILVPVDTQELEPAEPALQRARELAEASGGDVRVIYVEPLPGFSMMEQLPRDFFEKHEAKAMEDLKGIAGRLGLPSERVSIMALRGNVYDEVIVAAREFSADLIVVGSHRPSMSTYLLGSNAGQIVRHATCSVLVVR